MKLVLLRDGGYLSVPDAEHDLCVLIEGQDGEERFIPLDIRKIDVVYKDDFDVKHFTVNVYLGGGLTEDNRGKPTDSDEVRAEALETIKRGTCK